MDPIPYLPGENGTDYYRRSQAIIAQRRKAECDAETSRNRSAARQDRAADERQTLRYIFADLPTCDDCGSTDLQTKRTEHTATSERTGFNGEIITITTVITRSVRCRHCGADFRLVLEQKNLE